MKAQPKNKEIRQNLIKVVILILTQVMEEIIDFINSLYASAYLIKMLTL